VTEHELRALLAVATKRPWLADFGYESPDYCSITGQDPWKVCTVHYAIADVKLIVYAVNHLEQHLDRIAELEAANRELREALRLFQKDYSSEEDVRRARHALRKAGR